jgi:hypothetical protein
MIEDVSASADMRVPLVIGAIGHRDLLPSEIPQHAQRIRDFLVSLQQRYPDLRVTLLTSLADGADRLVADVAKSQAIPVVYVLPMPTDLYERDFTPESLAEYRQLLNSGNVLTLPLVRGNTAADVTHPGAARDLQYAQLGAFIAAHCHILLALWDGQVTGPAGGTAQVIRFHQDDYMPGLSSGEPRTRLDDADDESDLVFHVVCSRDRAGGAPLAPLQPGQTWWLSRDDQSPRTAAMPPRYEIVLRRMVEFSRDAMRNRDRITRDAPSLVPTGAGLEVGAGARAIDAQFRIADWLAVFYQRRELLALRLLCVFAAIASLCFIAYGDFADQQLMIYPYVAFMAAGLCAYSIERRGAWQRRHLDYRVLAEALRVQFFWAVAGVNRPALSRFGHDSFLKRQDLELGWIRNILRVAGTRDDAAGAMVPDAGIDLATRDWVGDEGRGQVGYYSVRSVQRLRLHRVTAVLGYGCFAAGLMLATWIALMQWWYQRTPTNVLVALIGLLPVIAAIRQSYAHRTAEHELINQYRFMVRIFANAQRQLGRTHSASERRRILRELGDVALREHSQWILRQRERPLSVN